MPSAQMLNAQMRTPVNKTSFANRKAFKTEYTTMNFRKLESKTRLMAAYDKGRD